MTRTSRSTMRRATVTVPDQGARTTAPAAAGRSMPRCPDNQGRAGGAKSRSGAAVSPGTGGVGRDGSPPASSEAGGPDQTGRASATDGAGNTAAAGDRTARQADRGSNQAEITVSVSSSCPPGAVDGGRTVDNRPHVEAVCDLPGNPGRIESGSAVSPGSRPTSRVVSWSLLSPTLVGPLSTVAKFACHDTAPFFSIGAARYPRSRTLRSGGHRAGHQAGPRVQRQP